MSSEKWFKYGEQLQRAETDPDGHLNLEQLAATLGLDPKTLQLDGVLRAYSPSGYTFTAIQGGDNSDSAIIVTGNPATAHLLTLYEVVTYPVAQLTQRLSPRSSASKTQPSQPRTFSDILPWPDFIAGCMALLGSLDNSERIYNAPSGRILPSASHTVRSAADEAEVRGRVLSLLDSINDVAEVLGIPVECTSGGSGRSSSFTDLVVRLTGSATNPAHLSALILAAGEVKGNWQFELERGETLEAALHDPKRIVKIVLAVQQVYGDAVFDEAPMLILTNYHVTVFLKRSADVQDKRLWASPPIWWDSTDPPARACWLYSLEQAHSMRAMKQKLPRFAVPPTMKGYHIPAQSQLDQPVVQDAGTGLRRSSRARTATLRLQATSASGKGYELDSLAARQSPASAASAVSAAPSSSGSAPPADPVLPLADLAITDKLLGAGQFGHVLQGSYCMQPVAVKLYHRQVSGATAAYENEKQAYQALEQLQGSAIPNFFGYGMLAHTAVPVIVTSVAGTALREGARVPPSLHKPMRDALKAFHDAGAAHGDVRLANFLVEEQSGIVRLADLGSTVLRATKDQQKAEQKKLASLLA
ncbi:hypothetical protein COCSUDRAFT_60291 [Coccomyxa subellipsoidea C-169]|uniref:Protein kinase domain-containing protein n=1 Tax=Coccomyxa subellipsoidea (strain C-169) TaxID=574566 RepID=I0YIV3_COCSC|nr:hypothetical protein COCSUDRAFT_60291 [Coccomyxa subellipsoidea C-169]EIE18322.1 hypothetical protein COCSUDRAFT_60291 [Coccomyxa subellipsoidea C-169]|eukprot:XP_005642866.1 hypothetical protein COCSUDRAFT_60291 [Coccomyxa subellipsoidea C-169]